MIGAHVLNCRVRHSDPDVARPATSASLCSLRFLVGCFQRVFPLRHGPLLFPPLCSLRFVGCFCLFSRALVRFFCCFTLPLRHLTSFSFTTLTVLPWCPLDFPASSISWGSILLYLFLQVVRVCEQQHVSPGCALRIVFREAHLMNLRWDKIPFDLRFAGAVFCNSWNRASLCAQ